MLNVYTTVGCERPFFSVTALATNVASRLSSAVVSVVSSFWGKKKEGQKLDARPNPAGQALTATSLRSSHPLVPLLSSFCLFDSRRRIMSATLSPQIDLCALTDSFGRVILLDTAGATMVRMWKGYRDAQTGWATAPSSVEHGEHAARECTFLVIHAPRRSLLEIWAMRSGGRVAAYNVPEGATLVHVPSTIFGPMKAFRDTCLLLCEDGRMFQITVPFSLAAR